MGGLAYERPLKKWGRTVHFNIGAVLNDKTLSVLEVAPEIDARGFHSMSVGEHTHMPVATKHKYANSADLPDIYKRFPDPWVTLTAAAACTKNVRLGTSICLIAEHNPIILAKTIATLDQLSGGRVDIGAGYGWNPPELLNNGVEFKNRRQVFRENILAMKALWAQETAAFDGEFVKFTESWAYPKPAQDPHPPIFIGAQPGPRTFHDIVTISDGWMPDRSWLGDQMEDHFKRLRIACQEVGRDSGDLYFTLSGVNGFRRNTIEEFRERLPSQDLIEKWRALGFRRINISIPVQERSFMLRCLDATRDVMELVS